jgi:hypothetical protein
VYVLAIDGDPLFTFGKMDAHEYVFVVDVDI